MEDKTVNYSSIMEFCQIPPSSRDEVISVLRCCGIVAYHNFSDLKEMHYVKDEISSFYFGRTGKSLTPGLQSDLRHIGRKIAEMKDDLFREEFCENSSVQRVTESTELEQYPLLGMLYNQVGRRNYDDLLLRMSALVKILGGSYLYEILADNSTFASPSTINHLIQYYPPAEEGVIQVIKPL